MVDDNKIIVIILIWSNGYYRFVQSNPNIQIGVIEW
jgi:hypothetical protein